MARGPAPGGVYVESGLSSPAAGDGSDVQDPVAERIDLVARPTGSPAKPFSFAHATRSVEVMIISSQARWLRGN